MSRMSCAGDGSEKDEVPYRRLWRAVLLQVLGEAEDKTNNMLAVSLNDRPRTVWRARKWICTDSEDLRVVCDRAGFEAEKLMAYGRRKYGRRRDSHK